MRKINREYELELLEKIKNQEPDVVEVECPYCGTIVGEVNVPCCDEVHCEYVYYYKLNDHGHYIKTDEYRSYAEIVEADSFL
jgi:hypothetical protein